ncbi:MAG: DUF3368 domain-containing protein [Gloeomargarita sp. SKYG116]|nr:DUF3368 domain-containing protein [Gloeomargarita sp. SKYG116]MDW8400297.1 DUF3368 domain-containing protein [Gloeomargarita sp. SKYGB_i_bin116]
MVDASPLILLFKSGQADLLPRLFEEIVIPQAVYEEVTVMEKDVVAIQLPTVTWYKQIVVPAEPQIISWELGAGESAVLSFALTHADYYVMIDDAAARRCAKALGIRTLGTVGAFILAKRRGLIESVGERLELVQKAGIWLSDELILLAKQEAGEN